MIHSRKIALLCLTVVVLISAEARAQEKYPRREIMRPLVLEYMMPEASLGFSWLKTDRAFNDNGHLNDMNADFTEMTGHLDLTFGIAENLQIGLGMPYIYRRMEFPGSTMSPFLPAPFSSGGSHETSVEGFGDLEATALLQIHRETVGRPTSVVIGAKGVFPIGESDLSDRDDIFIPFGAPSRGAYAVAPIFMVKEAYLNKFALLGSFEWDFYFRGRQEFPGGTADTDYGDVMKAGLEPIFQVSDHITIWLSMFYTKWQKSVIDGAPITEIEYKKAYLFEVRPAIELQLGPHFDIFVGTSWKALGENIVAGWPVTARLEARF